MSKSLIHSNSHLHDVKKRDKALEQNILSSSAVEGIKVYRDAQTGRFMQDKTTCETPVIGAATKSSRSQR